MAPNPTDLILRDRARRGVSKDGPVRRFVCTPWSVLRGRFAAPQDEVVGSYELFPVLNAGALAHRPWEAPAELARTF